MTTPNNEQYPGLDLALKVGLIAGTFLAGLIILVVKCCCSQRRPTAEREIPIREMPINRLNYGATITDSTEELTETNTRMSIA